MTQHVSRRREQIRLQNMRIAVAARRHHFDNRVGVPFLCECDDVGCRQIISLTREEYEDVRRDGAVFVVVPGHSSGREIVEERGAYAVIRKTDGEATVARALDPRSEP